MKIGNYLLHYETCCKLVVQLQLIIRSTTITTTAALRQTVRNKDMQATCTATVLFDDNDDCKLQNKIG